MVNGRLKGNSYENSVCTSLSRWLVPELPESVKVADLPLRRRSTAIIPIDGLWHGSGDILHKPVLDGRWPFAVECKKHEGWSLDGSFNPKWAVWSWWDQACAQATRGDLTPMLVCSRNFAPTYVFLRTDDARCLRPRGRRAILVRESGERLMVMTMESLVATDPDRLVRLHPIASTVKRSRNTSKA